MSRAVALQWRLNVWLVALPLLLGSGRPEAEVDRLPGGRLFDGDTDLFLTVADPLATDYVDELPWDGVPTVDDDSLQSPSEDIGYGKSQLLEPSAPAQASIGSTALSLSRLSAFVRGVLQSFGLQRDRNQPQQPPVTALSAYRHRFLPHYVSTTKGLRNLPAQLIRGQLIPALDGGGTTEPSSVVTQPKRIRPPGGTHSSMSTGTGASTTSISAVVNRFKQRIKAIYPGTVWCGDGNQAKSENDIGFFYLTDSCCRAHDLCPITIAAGEQFNRLKNNGYFTRSHCDCDKQFYNCLKGADTLVSNQIGYTYFNLLKPQCFRHEHPKVQCTKRNKGKCLSYVVDETQDKLWQWFDNLIY